MEETVSREELRAQRDVYWQKYGPKDKDDDDSVGGVGGTVSWQYMQQLYNSKKSAAKAAKEQADEEATAEVVAEIKKQEAETQKLTSSQIEQVEEHFISRDVYQRDSGIINENFDAVGNRVKSLETQITDAVPRYKYDMMKNSVLEMCTMLERMAELIPGNQAGQLTNGIVNMSQLRSRINQL